MTLDFLEFLKKSRGRFAFVATYEFDPLFFEKRILSSPAFDGACVVVFVDNERYQDILAAGRQGRGFDRDYFVIPVRRPGGVFHPKLYLSIGDKKAIASVGSNNCTSAGTGHNFELISTLESPSGETRNTSAKLIQAIFQQFQRYADDAGPISQWLKGEIFDQIADGFPWLADPVENYEGVELISSYDRPLWPQIISRLADADTDIRKIVLLAPFFDKNLRVVERIRSLWPAAAIQIISQSGYSNLPVERLAALQKTLGNIELVSATSKKAGRKMHAKALAFQTDKCTYWLAGSANMSNAALVGGNSEACLWFSTDQAATHALEQNELTFASINAEDFEATLIEEPSLSVEGGHGLKLNSIILTDEGQLLASIATPPLTSQISLRIFKHGETLPTFSWKIDPTKSDVAFSLQDDDQAKFDQPAVGQLLGVVNGVQVKSELCSVSQLQRLLRESQAVPASSNRLQRIMETGDGLIEYVDSLDGIDAAIDFMNNTNIRFNDGSGTGVRTGGKWRARDPFSGDVPDHWDIGSSNGSVFDLREAIWDFVQRHIQKRLQRHAERGNLAGLSNFLDIFRTLSQFLLAWNKRSVNNEVVVPTPFVTQGLQEILATLIGTREDDDPAPGFGRTILGNLRADEDLVRTEFNRLRVSGIVSATVEEMIVARAIFRQLSGNDRWTQTRRAWATSWIDEMELDHPSEPELTESATELRQAA